MATFATTIRSDIEIDLTTADEREQFRKEAADRLAAARSKIEAFEHDQLSRQFNNFVAKLKQDPSPVQGVWTVLDFEKVKTARGTVLVLQGDGSLLKTGKSPSRDTYTLTSRVAASKICALRLEALADKSLPNDGPGAAPNGNFALSEIEISAGPGDGSAPAIPVKIASAIATHQQNATNLSVASSLDGKPNTGWAVDGGGIGKDQAAIFQFEKPVGFECGTILTIKLRFEHPNAQHLIGRPRISITDKSDVSYFKASEGPAPQIAASLLQLADGKKLPADRLIQARTWFANTLPEYRQLAKEFADIEVAGPRKHVEEVQVTSEGLPPVKNFSDGRGYPHFYKQVYLLRRGDPNNKVEPVSQSFLRVLMRGGKNERDW